MKIISAGHICLDITPVFPDAVKGRSMEALLQPGKLLHMDAADVHTGGSVANTGLALKLGFTSVMYDCSTADYETNVHKVAEMVRICRAMNVTVEGELGHVGDNEGAGRLEKPSDYYTDPEVALDFARRTGIDALAVAVGNAHGDYKFPPKLDFDRIETIAGKTGLPLVLHGGSGQADEDFRIAVEKGICKLNIFTDLDKAGKAGAEQGLKEGAKTMMGLIPYEIEAMKAVVRERIRLSNSWIDSQLYDSTLSYLKNNFIFYTFHNCSFPLPSEQ